MIKEILDQIKQDRELRKNLTELKALIKEEANRQELQKQLDGNSSLLERLLEHEDAKVRKNAAGILGQIGRKEDVSVLYDAYKKEETQFVKSAYLNALKELDYREILPELKEHLIQLKKIIPEESHKKHYDEECKSLTELILDIEGVKKHRFIGWDIPSRFILLTNRNYQEATLEELKDVSAKSFPAGVMVKAESIRGIYKIRTVEEFLFQLDDVLTCKKDPIQAAKTILESNFLSFLVKRHDGSFPFFFRIELKGTMDLKKRSTFTKKMAGEMERASKQKLINSTSHYEVEIRLIENKIGTLNVLVKLFTIPDNRFSYRRNAVSASILPVRAALTAALTKKYRKEGAQVLDPFCGVGTMLIERHFSVRAGTMYGLDIFGEAIEMARENAERAGVIIHFINRDFFDFKHEYLFDEIITNMPFTGEKQAEKKTSLLYKKFFKKAKEHLKEDGVIIMYSRNRAAVKQGIQENGYQLEEEYEISKREGSYVFVIKFL